MELTITFTREEVENLIADKAAALFPIPAGRHFQVEGKYTIIPGQITAELVDDEPAAPQPQPERNTNVAEPLRSVDPEEVAF